VNGSARRARRGVGDVTPALVAVASIVGGLVALSRNLPRVRRLFRVDQAELLAELRELAEVRDEKLVLMTADLTAERAPTPRRRRSSSTSSAPATAAGASSTTRTASSGPSAAGGSAAASRRDAPQLAEVWTQLSILVALASGLAVGFVLVGRFAADPAYASGQSTPLEYGVVTAISRRDRPDLLRRPDPHELGRRRHRLDPRREPVRALGRLQRRDRDRHLAPPPPAHRPEARRGPRARRLRDRGRRVIPVIGQARHGDAVGRRSGGDRLAGGARARPPTAA
jgi:hypothetical protein